MSEEKNKSNKWVLWIEIIVVVIAIVFVLFKLIDFSNEKTIETYETKQYKEYLSGLKEYANNMDTSMDVEDAKVDFLEKVQEYGKTYDDGDGTGYANTLLTSSVIENNDNDTGNFLNSIISILDSLLNTNIGGNSSIVSKALTLKSYTVCETIGGNYCLSDNGLSANVYISDANSNKWAVLLHGVNMTGKQIYSTLGEMYTSQGYNVIAPNDYISKKDLDVFKDRYMFELNKILLEKEEINNSSSSKENIDRIKKIKSLGKLDYIDRNILNELVDVIYINE